VKTERSIFIAFILNLGFSILELIGGALTGSVAIVSDALHDAGDAASIGVAYFLERRSKKQADATYTYGYARFSVLGGVVTTMILLLGSVAVICNAVARIFNPVEINYNGMIVFAIIGAAVNFCAAWFTRQGESLNQKAVNLHMLEDVLGWLVVLIGAVVMRFTHFVMLDALMSIGVALFIFYHAVLNMKKILDLFVEKVPEGLDVAEIRGLLCRIEGVEDVHHIHVRSMDGSSHYASMHVVTDADNREIKARIRQELKTLGIVHATLELEHTGEPCGDMHCHVECENHHHHHHHH